MGRYVAAAELCGLLGVSRATLNNWVRLGKIRPAYEDGGKPLFDADEVKAFAGENGLLKSRRNKSRISGAKPYERYLASSANLPAVREIVRSFDNAPDAATLRLVLANAALQLMLQAKGRHTYPQPVAAYLSGKLDVGSLSALADELIGQAGQSFESCPLTAVSQPLSFVRGEDTLGCIYISLSDIGKRKQSGVYYTPPVVARKLVSAVRSSTERRNLKVLDPCCGTGNLLMAASEISDVSGLFGVDTDSISVALARINLALMTGCEDVELLKNNIVCENFFSYTQENGFDAVIGNPPWGSRLNEEERTALKDKLCCAASRQTDVCDLFIEQGLRVLSQEGALSYVIPEAVFNVAAHEPVRRLLADSCDFKYTEYLGEAFSGVNCPSVIMTVKRGSGSLCGCSVAGVNESFTILADRKAESSAFLFNVTDGQQECLDALINGSRAFLKDNADFALGIVTGDNKSKLFSSPAAGLEPVFRGGDVCRFRCRDARSYLRFEPQNFQQTADERFYRAPEKLLYRFICSEPVFAYDSSGTLSLNSCNVLIPHIEGLSIKYILAVLNSSAVAFFCNKSFSSVKLLRSHIESVPIPVPSPQRQLSIVGLTDELIGGKGDSRSIYARLDDEVFELYGLSQRQRSTVEDFCKGRKLYLP